MSTPSNTTIVVQYDLYKTTLNYSISINKPNIIHNIKFTNLPTSTQQRKNTQNKYIEKPVSQKEIIIVNNNTSMYLLICMIIAFFLFFIIVY